MTIAPLLLAAALTAPAPCAELEPWGRRLRALSAAELEQELSALEAWTGASRATVGADRERWIAKLAAACGLWASSAVEASPDRARLEEILRRKEFEHARRGNAAVLQRLFHRLVAWLKELLASDQAGSFADLSRFAVLLVVSAGAVAGALRLIALRRRRRRGLLAAAAQTAERLELDAPSQHLDRARAALSGDPREAIRQGLLALLSALERAELARPDRVKTNRELAQELPERGAPPELTERVEALLRWYDLTFYSLAPVQEEEARSFVERVAALPGVAG